ncbi:hypothetical protein GWI34_22045 [Actinomadura sp. DSM 109109]|nr:hypothetical protein [Actinomadura lepetitiana]
MTPVWSQGFVTPMTSTVPGPRRKIDYLERHARYAGRLRGSSGNGVLRTMMSDSRQ